VESLKTEVFNTVQALIANFSIVTAYLFLASQVIFKNRHFDTPASLSNKLNTGIAAGVFGVVLMIFTVNFHGTILDFRQLAVIYSAIFGGVISAIVTGAIIFLMRLLAFGSVSPSSIIAASNSIILAIGVGFVCQMQLSYYKKWFYSLLINNVLTSAVFFVILGEKGSAHVLIYILMTSIGGALAASMTLFLINEKSQLHRMKKESTTDFLTGLNNHRKFDEVLNTSLKQSREKNELLSVLMVDIDHFKQVNDTYGHLNGDTVLNQLGGVLKKTARSFDVVSRIGGEEFSVLLFDCPHDYALIISERIRLGVKGHTFVLNDGRKIELTISIGVATLSENQDENIIEQADLALYKAKANGRDMICSNILEPKPNLFNMR
jgi:diguanylate cyclase